MRPRTVRNAQWHTNAPDVPDALRCGRARNSTNAIAPSAQQLNSHNTKGCVVSGLEFRVDNKPENKLVQ